MSALGSLVVKLALEYAQFTTGLDKSEQAALQHAKRMQEVFDGVKGQITGAMSGVVGVAGAVAGGMAAAFTIKAFKGLIADIVQTGAALDDLSMQTGATVEALSGLAAIGKFNDMSAEAIGGAMNKLTANLAGATEESKGTSQAIQSLGLDLKQFKQLKPEDQMQAVAKALDEFQDGAAKSAVMMALYGKEGAKMLPFMKDLASAGELQGKVTAEQAASAAQLDDNWVKLSKTVQGAASGITREIATGMVPAFDQAVQAALGVLSGTNGIRKGARDLAADGSIERWTKSAITGLSYVLDVGEYALRVLMATGKAAAGMVAAIVQAASGNWSGAWQALQASGEDMIATFTRPTLGVQFRDSLAKIGQSAEDASGATKKAKLNFENLAAGADKGASAAQRLAASGAELAASLIGQESANLSADFAKKWDSLSAAYKAGAINLDLLTSAQAALLAQQPYMKAAHEALAKAAQAAADARKKEADGIADWLLAQEQAATAALATVRGRITSLRDEEEALALSRAQNVSLAEAVEMLAVARMQEAQAAKFYEGSDGWLALQKEIDARKELLGLMSTKAVREKEESGWNALWQSVDRTAHDTFTNIFEGGQDAFTKLKNVLKATLLDLLYQMTVKQWVFNITAAVTGTSSSVASAAVNASSGSGLLSGASSLNSLNSMVTGNSLSSSIGSLAGTVTGLTAANTALATSIGIDAASAAAASSAAAAAGGASTATAGLAAIGPAGWAAMAAIAAYAIFAKSGETRAGGQYGYSTDGTLTNNRRGTTTTGNALGVNLLEGPSGGEIAGSTTRQAIAGTVEGINTLLTNLGSQAAITGYQAGLESSSNDRGGVFSGGTLTGGLTFGESGRGDNYGGTLYESTSSHNVDSATAAANFATDLNQSIIQALQIAQDIPQTIKALVAGVDAEALSDSAVTQLLAVINAQVAGVEAFRAAMIKLPLKGLTDLSFDATAALAAAAGGFEALGNSLSSYYDNFYTDEEKRLQTIKGINAAVAGSGLDAATATRASYRALMESQDVTTESGRKMYAALLGASSAFASITTAVDGVASARAGLIDAYKAEQAAMQGTVEKFRGFAADLRSFRDGLLTGSLSPLTPAQRYAETSGQFDRLLAATQTGTADERAAAYGKLQGASSALLEASKAYNASGNGYLVDFDRVREALSGAAIGALATADVAQLQLDAAKSQLAALGEIDKSVLSVGQAIAALAKAQQEAGTAGTVSLPGFAVGTNYVPHDMIAQIHQGEAIVPRAYNPAAGGQAQSDALAAALLQRVDALTGEIQRLSQQQSGQTAAVIQAVHQASANNADSINNSKSKTGWSKQPELA